MEQLADDRCPRTVDHCQSPVRNESSESRPYSRVWPIPSPHIWTQTHSIAVLHLGSQTSQLDCVPVALPHPAAPRSPYWCILTSRRRGESHRSSFTCCTANPSQAASFARACSTFPPGDLPVQVSDGRQASDRKFPAASFNSDDEGSTEFCRLFWRCRRRAEGPDGQSDASQRRWREQKGVPGPSEAIGRRGVGEQ